MKMSVDSSGLLRQLDAFSSAAKNSSAKAKKKVKSVTMSFDDTEIIIDSASGTAQVRGPGAYEFVDSITLKLQKQLYDAANEEIRGALKNANK